jgi:hypothetical protein
MQTQAGHAIPPAIFPRRTILYMVMRSLYVDAASAVAVLEDLKSI